jgi:hypothetical protein
LALKDPLVRKIAERVSKQCKHVELFVSGILHRETSQSVPRNGVFACTFFNNKPLFWVQNKHHRWKLDRDQIRRYHLGSRLNPDCDWWERIDISQRECEFRVFRRGASMAALVCEDLARIDPVQSVIRSVGPNLVIALLMDGPQMEKRWSGRYATVLADDPGSSVLSFTSLALVRRSSDPGHNESRQVALWKQAGGKTEELLLPKGNHALLLTLWPDRLKNFTIDGRSDRGNTVKIFLSGVHAISHPNPADWFAVD